MHQPPPDTAGLGVTFLAVAVGKVFVTKLTPVVSALQVHCSVVYSVVTRPASPPELTITYPALHVC